MVRGVDHVFSDRYSFQMYQGRIQERRRRQIKLPEVQRQEVEEKKKDQEIEQPKTESQIIVKSDGSRILVVTTNAGGMQTTMSLEICKPTALQSNASEEMQDIKGGVSPESV